MKMNTDIMIDMETLATGVQPTILTIGACKFNPFGDEIKQSEMEVLYLRLDIESQTALGRDLNDDTVDWWGRQTPEAQEEALGEGTPDNPRYSLEEAMDRLYKFCWGAKRVWSNGATADIIWAETAFKQIERANPWKFWEIRDVRTAFDLGINPNMPPVTAHNALEDAINQAIGIQNVYRTLRNCTFNDGTYIEPFKDWKKSG
jgi:hypothetical protein